MRVSVRKILIRALILIGVIILSGCAAKTWVEQQAYGMALKDAGKFNLPVTPISPVVVATTAYTLEELGGKSDIYKSVVKVADIEQVG